MPLYDKVLIVDEVLIQGHKVLIGSITLVVILHLRVQRFDSNKRLIKPYGPPHFGRDLVVNISALLSALLSPIFVVENHAQREDTRAPIAPMPNVYRTKSNPLVGPIRSILGLTRTYFGSMQAPNGSNTNHFGPLRPISVLTRIHVGPIQTQNGTNPNPYRTAPIHIGSRTSPCRANTSPERTQSESISDRSDSERFAHESISGQTNPERTQDESITDRSDPYRCRTNPIRTNATPARIQHDSISGRSDPDRFSHESTSGQYKSITEPTRIHIGPLRSRSALARVHVGPIQLQNGTSTNPYRADPIHIVSHTNPLRVNTNP